MLTWRGLVLVEATPGYLKAQGLSGAGRGMYVKQCPAESTLREAGLRVGSIISTYDGQPVETVAAFIVADDAAGSASTLRLTDGSLVSAPAH